MILNNEVTKIREKYGDGIILFHTIGFNYECVAKDARTVSQECGYPIERDGLTNYCMVRPSKMDTTVSFLLAKGHKIAVLDRNDKASIFLPTT